MAPDEAARRIGAGAAGHELSANYEYWRAHGGDWVAEYARRRQRSVLYNIQELMLADYVLRHAEVAAQPLAVLDYGCGIGRHLRNLRRIPNVDCYGFDQSPSMVEGCLAWSDSGWFDSHVLVGEPVGTLPFPDGRFDLVYTTEVLVHTRPEDLDAVLAELVRVCRGHILHLEPAPSVALIADAHDGCWGHDLPASYARFGRTVEVLPGAYRVHVPYRIVVGERPHFTWHPAIIELYRQVETAMDAGAVSADQQVKSLEAQVESAEAELRAARLAMAEAASREASLAEERQALAGRVDDLERELAATREETARLTTAHSAVEIWAAEARTRIEELEQRERDLRGTLAQEAARIARLVMERRTFVAQASRLLGT
jgi:SAM-dependent methyltransferase